MIPVGSYNAEYGVTLSLPSVVGQDGVSRVVWPELSDEERHGLEACATRLKSVVERYASRT